MHQAPHLPPLLAELTSDAMLDLPMSARLLWSLLTSRPASPEPLRLNLKRVKMAAFPFDADVTIDSLSLDVLMLEERGLLTTSVGPDGRERYRILTRPTTAPTAPHSAPANPYEATPQHAAQTATQPAPSGHIASVERESESESTRETPESRRPSTRRPELTPPARYCADHLPYGPGTEECLLCMQAREQSNIWLALVKNGQTPPADLSIPPAEPNGHTRTTTDTPRSPQSGPDPHRRRRPRFGPPDPMNDPESPDYIPDDILW